MPVYTYRAKKGPTETVAGELSAQSEDEAVRRIEGMGLIPVNVMQKRSSEKGDSALFPADAGKRALSPFSRVKTSDVDIFTRQLSSLIRASVSVVGALSLIGQETENKALRSVVLDLESEIKRGKLLSEAMEMHKSVFNNLFVSLVKAGEKGGVLEETLSRLAEHRERDEEIRRKIQAALAYPSLMVLVGAGTVFVMLTFFLPKLVGLFENMRQALPMPTRILIAISTFMSANWYWVLLGAFIFIVMFGRVKPGSKKKIVLDLIMLRVPFVRKFIMNSEIAKFARTLGVLLESGISIHESLNLATNTLDNETLKEHLTNVSTDIISHGATLSASLKKIDIFPAFATNMISVGEEGGKLEGALKEIASSYEREVDQSIKITTSLIEPILILVVGAVVGFIVFAMLMPIFNIGIMGS